MTRDRWWADPEFCEQRVLPVVAAFGAGVILTVIAADALRDQNHENTRAVQAELAEWRNACAQLLTLPPSAAPMVFGAMPAAPDAARYRPEPEASP